MFCQRFRLTSAKVLLFFELPNDFGIFFGNMARFLLKELFVEHEPSERYAGIHTLVV